MLRRAVDDAVPHTSPSTRRYQTVGPTERVLSVGDEISFAFLTTFDVHPCRSRTRSFTSTHHMIFTSTRPEDTLHQGLIYYINALGCCYGEKVCTDSAHTVHDVYIASTSDGTWSFVCLTGPNIRKHEESVLLTSGITGWAFEPGGGEEASSALPLPVCLMQAFPYFTQGATNPFGVRATQVLSNVLSGIRRRVAATP
jgi:hypothetical protein